MTDQRQSYNPPHQHGPYPPAPSSLPALPGSSPTTLPADMPGSASPVTPRSKRPVIVAAVAGVVALGLMVVCRLVVYDSVIKKDPGIAMCEASSST